LRKPALQRNVRANMKHTATQGSRREKKCYATGHWAREHYGSCYT